MCVKGGGDWMVLHPFFCFVMPYTRIIYTRNVENRPAQCAHLEEKEKEDEGCEGRKIMDSHVLFVML